MPPKEIETPAGPTIEELQQSITQMQAQHESSLGELKSNNEALQADNDKWKHKQQEAEKHRKAQEQKTREAAEEAARASGDIEAIEKSWNDKYNNMNLSHEEARNGDKVAWESKETELKNVIHKITVTAQAQSLADSIAIEGSSEAFKYPIESRLYTDMVDGNPVVKVLGKDGKPSALTLDDLKNEFMENPAFAPLVRASSANGSGGASSEGSGGKNKMSRDAFETLSQNEKSSFIRGGGQLS